MLKSGDIVKGKEGTYKILSQIGSGGMSHVYLAVNEKTKEKWAVKEVRRDGVKDFQVVNQSLVAETDILKKLSHPNLPRIVDIIENEKSFLIVMDFIEGRTLMDIIKESGAQPEIFVIEWAKQLCDVLDYLHTRKPAIIYRDMKPSNVMLRPDGSVCVIDFGTAREYKEQNLADTVCLGTFGYAAPEQFGGFGQTDARTDIYCLGATLYHLITGINPADPPYEMRPIRQYDESLSIALERIIIKCTQSNPDDRFQSCMELKRALCRIDDAMFEYRHEEQKKVNVFLVSIIAALLSAAVGVGALILNNIQNVGVYNTISLIAFILFGVCLAASGAIYIIFDIKKARQILKKFKASLPDVYDMQAPPASEAATNQTYRATPTEAMQSAPAPAPVYDDYEKKRQSVREDIFAASATTEINDTMILNIINSKDGRFLIVKNEMLINTDKTI